MKKKWQGNYSTVFGAILDTEIAEALKCGMTLEGIYAEMTARTRELAEQIVRNHLAVERALRESAEREA